MKTLEPLLAEHPFFKNIDAGFLKLLTGCAKNVRFEEGQFIFRQGEDADCFYIIRHGTVALELHGSGGEIITIETLGEGDVLGWSWLVPPFKWHLDAQARSLVRAISLDGKCLRKKCDADHSLGYEMLNRFMPLVVDRMKHMELQILDIYGNKRK